MGWLLRNNWPWSLLAFLLGAVITWFLLVRREPPAQAVAQPVEENEEVLVGAAVSRTAEHPPAAAVEVHAVPPAARVVPEEPRPTFSRRMEAERVETPAGRFDTVRIDATTRRADRPNDRPRPLHVWFGTDTRRLPVAIVSEVDIGPVSATLSAIRGAR